MWTNARFRGWLTATGLSVPQAAVVLDVSERTLKRIRTDEDVSIKDSITAAAQAYLGQSRTTTGTDAEQLDSWASQADLSDLCRELPYAHVTGLTSAIARGWTSSNSSRLRQVAQPIRMPQRETVGDFRLEWIAGHGLPWGVECRDDAEGTPYRIASIKRTLLDLADHESWIGIDDVIESFRGAFKGGEQQPYLKLLMTKAKERGAETIDRVQYYLSPRQLGTK